MLFNRYYAEHQIFIENVRRLLELELAPKVEGWERDGLFPNEVFSLLGKNGFLGILLPEKFGGIEGDYKLAGAWCETFGELPSVGLTVAVNMHSLVISHALALYGSESDKQHWLPSAIQGTKIGAYAFTEPGCGSDLARLRTRAVFSNGKWKINGSKTFITNGARADFVLVLARTNPDQGYKGFTTFVVDTTTPGFKVSKKLDKLGWRASDTAELTLEDVEVKPENILGNEGEGWIQASKNLNWERMMLTLTSLGAARSCFRDVTKYAQERKAFGKSLTEFGVLQDMLDEMKARIVQGEAISYEALDLLSAHKDCRAEVSAAKRKVCEDAIWIADRAIQIHGGYGYTTEFSPERWWRDLRIMTIGGGTSEIMANVVAKQLGLD